MDSEDCVWTKKGATLSDKSAREEFGLTEAEIIEVIRAGKLRYRENWIYGNPYLRLVRSEVEALVRKRFGTSHLETKKIQAELAQVNKELPYQVILQFPPYLRETALISAYSQQMEPALKGAVDFDTALKKMAEQIDAIIKQEMESK